MAIFVYGGTLGADGGYTKTGYPLRDVKGAVLKLERSDQAQNHVLKFPKENTLMDIDWLGLIDRKNKALYSRVLVDEKVKASIPRPLKLAPFQGRNGLQSREIEIVDSRTFVIRDFSFKGRAPDTHFLIGVAGTIPNDIDGYVIPNESGSHSPLGSYDNQTIILSIPSDKPDLNKAKWLSIWSQKIKLSLAHVLLPAKMNVPPSLDTLGAEPEPSLNCEELDADLGLELRWTLSQDEIILQLVSNTGDDRYLALGIRDPTESKGIAGDVVVGWISASSGKGGLDDYFLAGKQIACDDGAESCPDKSKGGTKDIELLNAVSRANYTMLTFKRPLKARGNYDVDILVNTDQYIFWSVGFKSAAMRKIHKPLKNLDPIGVNFGRKPTWNCLTAGNRPPSSAQKENKPAPPASSQSKVVDQPRRRIASPSILTPPYDNKEQVKQVRRPAVRPTRRPVVRNRVRPSVVSSPVTKNSWTDWFSPPTKPEVNGGGFVPQSQQTPTNPDWNVPNIGCGETADEPLYVHLGPATSARGNQGLGTDGTALYINGLLAPELTLQRGKEYTFVIETGVGSDPAQTFHPFYVTSDPAGGRQLKTELEARAEQVYGGISVNGQGKVMPSAMGKLCRWTSSRPAMTFANFLDFHNSLELKCEKDHASTMSSLLRSSQASIPSVFKFKPDNTMPDELFYQSFMAKHLGNKIHIKDYCYNSQQLPQKVTTYRPSVIQHLEQSELLTRAETRREPSLPYNRRIDEDAYDYDYNSFDNHRDLINKCKRRSRVKGRSLDSNLEMPTFEHFPMRDIIRTSGIDETLPNEEECRRLLQAEAANHHQQSSNNDFPKHLKFDKSGLDSRFNPNQERIISRTTMTPKQRPWTTPMSFMKTRLPSNPTTTPFMASTTTPRAIMASTPTPSWNTAKPEFNPYQLDPSLLHNGFLFDKRKMEARKPQPVISSTRRPSIFRNTFANNAPTATTRSFSTSVTFKPRLTTTTTMPTLPPPGGDVPSYMSYVNEAKAYFEASKKKTNPIKIEPPILKKIPMPMSSVVPKKEPAKEETNNGPLSMLSGMFMPSWFQDSNGGKPVDKVEPPPPNIRKSPPIQNNKPAQRVQNGQGMPLLPPPKNFPSFDNAKRKANRPPPPQIMNNRPKPMNQGPNKRPKPPPPQRGPPKSSKIAVGAGNYADFVRQEFQSLYPTKPPVQLIPRKNAEFISPYAVGHLLCYS